MRNIRILCILATLAFTSCNDNDAEANNQTPTPTPAQPPQTQSVTPQATPPDSGTTSMDAYLAAVQTYYEQNPKDEKGLICNETYYPLTENPEEMTEAETAYKTSIMDNYRAMEQGGYVNITQGDSSKRPGERAYIVTPTQKYLDTFGEPKAEKRSICFGKKVAVEIRNLTHPSSEYVDKITQTADVLYRVEEYLVDPVFQKGDPAEIRSYMHMYIPENSIQETVDFAVSSDPENPQPVVENVR